MGRRRQRQNGVLDDLLALPPEDVRDVLYGPAPPLLTEEEEAEFWLVFYRQLREAFSTITHRRVRR
jgi:hypothetical protein